MIEQLPQSNYHHEGQQQRRRHHPKMGDIGRGQDAGDGNNQQQGQLPPIITQLLGSRFAEFCIFVPDLGQIHRSAEKDFTFFVPANVIFTFLIPKYSGCELTNKKINN